MNSRILVCWLLVLSIACARGTEGGKGAEKPVPVTAADVLVQEVPREILAVGTVESSSTVEIVPQVTGVIEEVKFAEGDFVEPGAPLFSIDTRPYDATLAVARTELGIDEQVVVAPEAAVQRGQQGSYVFVIDEAERVRHRAVEVSRTRGTDAVIRNGLTGGERVVTDGHIRVKDGAEVTVLAPETAHKALK